MSIFPQISIPLALHLTSPIIYDSLTDERWRPGEKSVDGRSVKEFSFIDRRSGRMEATREFGAFFRVLYEHPDWSQLHDFFSRRYATPDVVTPSSVRTLVAPPNSFESGKSAIVHFNTNPTIVGLPQGFPQSLGETGRKSLAGITGIDPLNCAIGPALSGGLGPGGYMDLIYAGNSPGAYPASLLSSNKYNEKSNSMSHIRKGGRGRSLAEWHELWSTIAEWIYEHDSTMVEYVCCKPHSYKFQLSDDEFAELSASRKIARKFLQTDAIHAADGIRDMFTQLAADPVRFQGLEWDFLELQVPTAAEQSFKRRFGAKSADPAKNFEELTRDISLGAMSWNRLVYDEISPENLKPCPDTFRGADWEAWMLSIRGGDIVAIKTVFQALWAVMLLTELPLTISIIENDAKFPRLTDPDTVYL